MRESNTNIEQLFKIMKECDFKEEVVVEMFKQLSTDKSSTENEDQGSSHGEEKQTEDLSAVFRCSLGDLRPSVFCHRSLEEQLKQTAHNFMHHLHISQTPQDEIPTPHPHHLSGISSFSMELEKFKVVKLARVEPLKSDLEEHFHISQNQLMQLQPTKHLELHNVDQQTKIEISDLDSIIEIEETPQSTTSSFTEPDLPDIGQKNTENNHEESKIQKDELEKQDISVPLKQIEYIKINQPQPQQSTSNSKPYIPSNLHSPPKKPPQFITTLLKELEDEQPELTAILKALRPRSMPLLLRHLSLLSHHVTLCESLLKQKVASLK